MKANVRLMTRDDQAEIFHLARISPMKLPGLELVYDRSPDFQKLLNCQGPQFETYVAHVQEELIGLASVSWKQRFENEKSLVVGYLCDLRMKKRRESARVWRDFYEVILSDEYKRQRGINYYITAVLADNQQAIKNLTQSKNNRFKYHFLERQTMVNVLGLKPWHQRQNLSTKKLPARHLPTNWILENSESKHLRYPWQQGEKDYRETNWPEWSKSSVLSVLDVYQDTVALCVPWSPSACKRMIIQNLNWKMKIFLRSLEFFGFPKLEEGEAIDSTYLTTLNFKKGTNLKQKTWATGSLIREILKSNERPHMVSFSDVWGVHKESEFRSQFFVQTSEVLLFQVTRLDEKALDFDRKIPFEFEMVLV